MIPHNLMKRIQMQLSQKRKILSQFLAEFLKYKLNLKYLKKKMTLIHFVLPKLRTPKT